MFEFLSRYLFKHVHKIPQLAWGVDAVENIMFDKSGMKGQFSPRTYGLYWQAENYSVNGFKQTDSNGFRWKGYDVSKEKSTTRILAYGGSTTFSNYFLPNPKDSWPYILESKINADKNLKKVEVINAGLNYGMTSEILCHFIFEGSTFKPDILILHGPGNDMLPISSGDSTLDYRLTRRLRSTNARKFEKNILKFSGTLRMLYVIWLRGNDSIQLEPQEFDEISVQNDRLLSIEPIAFKNNVSTLVDICLQRNIKLVLIDFILAPEESLKKLKPGISTGMMVITEKMNGFFAQLASSYENQIIHIASTEFSLDEKFFGDTCHLFKDGEISKAETIYNKFRHFLV